MRFAREHENWDENEWSRVLFTDESRFCLRSPDGSERVWRRAGEHYAEFTFGPRVSYQGGSVMVWAGISLDSRTELFLISRGTINAERYINEILADYVVPCAQLGGNGSYAR